MELNYNVVSIVDILCLMQGVILGIVLLVMNKRKERPTLFLALFLLVNSLELLPVILEDINLIKYYPKLILFPVTLGGFVFPLFYLYVQKISIFSKSKLSYWVLYPAAVFVLIDIISVSYSTATREATWFITLDFVNLFFSIFIGFKTIYFLNKHFNVLVNQYTSTELKDLKWARLLTYIGLSTYFIFFFMLVVEIGFYFHLTYSSFLLALTYWVSFKGIAQLNVENLISEDTRGTLNSIQNTTAFILVESSTEEATSLLKDIEKFVIGKKAFLLPDLTIVDLSNEIGVHPKRISKIINMVCHKNFNSYVNTHRINEAKELLKANHVNNFSIEGIGYQVGFKSKSAFYQAFKKYTNTTPLNYKRDK
ncbi:MAG: helix-turn-helix domain-containing protein [Cellulophaga sp.]